MERDVVGARRVVVTGASSGIGDATARLFRDGHDPLVVIKWKDIHEDLEQAVDSCERSAHVLESIYLKNR